MELDRAMAVSVSGMSAQAHRLRVIAENIANRDSTGQSPGADPYRRKTVTFGSKVDRNLGVSTVEVVRQGRAPGAFPQRFDPSHPAADANGYVKTPNVDSLIENMDMREANRSYSANLAALETTRGMMMRAIESLR